MTLILRLTKVSENRKKQLSEQNYNIYLIYGSNNLKEKKQMKEITDKANKIQ